MQLTAIVGCLNDVSESGTSYLEGESKISNILLWFLKTESLQDEDIQFSYLYLLLNSIRDCFLGTCHVF